MTNKWKDTNLSVWYELLKGTEPVDSSLGTHCFDSTFKQNGETYRVTWEYTQDEPLGVKILLKDQIEVKKHTLPKFKTIHIEMLFNPKGEPVCKNKKTNCMFLAVKRFGTEYICNYRTRGVELDADKWVRPHDKCVVHTEEE